MQTSAQLAKHLRDVHFGGNWTWSNLRDHLSDLDWQQVNTKIHGLNTIVALVYHINYYISGVCAVLSGGPLTTKDEFSFDHPPVNCREDWENLLQKTWADAETLATQIEQLPDSRLWETFVDPKYGTYYRNFQGIIEHTHYHLGQIVVIKKILLQS